MKTPPPDLPDTDDPWTLLGVERNAAPDEIRRAYLRRIKVYKPDLHPEPFRRLREAYDRIYQAPDRGGGFGGWIDDDETPPVRDSIEDGWGRSVDPADPAPPEAPRPSAPRTGDRARIDALLGELREAMRADDRARAVELLLRPEVAPLANDARVADEVVRIACAVVMSEPERFEELLAAYHDILLDRALEHRDGVLTHLRGAAGQWPAFQRATHDLPALARFVEMWGVLSDGELVALGHEVGAAATEDPARVLAGLDRAARDAPAVLELYVQLAHEWADRWGPLVADDADGSRAALVEALGGLMDRNPVLSREQLRRNLASIAIATVVLWVASSRPLLSAMVTLVVSRLLYTVTSDPTQRIYREALRPAIAAWLWQGHEIGPLVEDLRRRVAAAPSGRKWLLPDRIGEYPRLLDQDLALAAYAATARINGAAR